MRNPFDRAVSLYSYSKKLHIVPGDFSFLDFWQYLSDNKIDQIGLCNRQNLSQCNSQIRWVENVSIDHVGKYENLDEDIEVVLKHVGLPTKQIQHLNQTNHVGYAQTYCEESADIIKHL